MKHHQRHTLKEANTPDEPTLDISSLIDVCFLLLIYFLVTTTIMPREQDLSNPLPASTSTPDNLPPVPPMVLELRQGGEVVVNPGEAAEILETDTDSRQMPNLRMRLGSVVGTGASGAPRVMVKVHDEVKQQRYIDLLNCLASAGIHDIAMVD